MKQPNNWTCYPTCVSFLTGIPLNSLLEELGHDGSPEGYSHSEVAFALLKLGWSSTAVYPVLTEKQVNCPKPEKVLKHLYKFDKLIITEKMRGEKDKYHCLAYRPKDNILLDPLTGENIYNKKDRKVKILYVEVLNEFK